MCAAYGQASGVPDPINLVEDLGVRGSSHDHPSVLSHYMSNEAKSTPQQNPLDAVAQGW